MNLSPLDVSRQTFRTAFGGFVKADVTAFLAAVASDYEQALAEIDRLRREMVGMRAALDERREHERTLTNTLMAAQKLADDIKAAAEEDARRLVGEAQDRSEALLSKMQARLEDVQREIDGLKLKRAEVETSIEAIIQALRHTLEFVREQDPHGQGGLPPRHSEASAEDVAQPQPSREDASPDLKIG